MIKKREKTRFDNIRWKIFKKEEERYCKHCVYAARNERAHAYKYKNGRDFSIHIPEKGGRAK